MGDFEKENATVALACRRPECDSTAAVELPTDTSSTRKYSCVSCGYTWTTSVGGGPFNLNDL